MTNVTWEKASEKELNSFAGFTAFTKNKEHSAEIRKSLIVVPEGTTLELPVLLSHSGITILEILQQPYSKLTLNYVDDGASTLVIKLTLENGATGEVNTALAGNAASTLVQHTILKGAGSSLVQRTLFFGNNENQFDMFSKTELLGENTNALIEAKGVLAGKATARFDGGITIKEGATKALAKLLENTLLLSSDARMDAIPGLTIETNDVQASHAASMTRIDDEQLFYCRSRGIDTLEATNLIVEGFLKGMYDGLPTEKDIDRLIHKKLCTV